MLTPGQNKARLSKSYPLQFRVTRIVHGGGGGGYHFPSTKTFKTLSVYSGQDKPAPPTKLFIRAEPGLRHTPTILSHLRFWF